MAKMFYTLEEVCSKLEKDEDEVRAMVQTGQIQEFRDRDKLMFKVEQIDLITGGEEDTSDVHIELDTVAAATDVPDESSIGLADSHVTTGLVDASGSASASGLWLADLLLAPQSASAQLNACLDAAVGSSFSCVANDVSLGVLIVTDPGSVTCTETSPGSGDFEASDVEIQARLIGNATERYDIGMWIALDEGDARTGLCLRNYLPAEPNALADIVTYDPLSGAGPYFDAESAPPPGPDLCGDLEKDRETFYDLLELAADGTPEAPFNNVLVTLPCKDDDQDGFVDVSSCELG